MKAVFYKMALACAFAWTCPLGLSATANSIRAVDFRNFTYGPACSQDKVTVTNGRFDGSDPDEPIHFFVNNVAYGNLDEDGQEEAIVLTHCNLGGTGIFSEGFLFALQEDKPVQVARIDGGDRAMGGIKTIYVEGRLLKVAREYGMAACCANYIETTSYRLCGKDLVPVGNPARVAAPGSGAIKTLQFQRGNTSASVSGKITENNEQYSLRAHAAQVLEAEPLDESSSENAEVEMIGPDGAVLSKEQNGSAWRFVLPLTGIYDFVVYSRNADVPYSFKVTIR